LNVSVAGYKQVSVFFPQS